MKKQIILLSTAITVLFLGSLAQKAGASPGSDKPSSIPISEGKITKGSFDFDHDRIYGKSDNCPGIYNLSQTDDDGDGRGNDCDNCTDIANTGQADNDEDGVGNECDNCPEIFNDDQLDTDADGIGDVCEPDAEDPENDGIENKDDNCPDVYNPDQTNTDGDDFGDVCDECPNGGTLQKTSLGIDFCA